MDVEKNDPETEQQPQPEPTQPTESTTLSPTRSPQTYNDASDPPPSYNSVVKRLQSVKQESSGPVDLCKRIMVTLCSSVFGTICLALTFAVPLAMIIIGSIHLHDCQIQRFIPIFLIVKGCFGILQIFLTGSLRVANQVKKKEDENARPNPGTGIISCFLFAWFIAGSVWVYQVYRTVDTSNPDSLNYCHPQVYWFAFVFLTVTYALLALSLCCTCVGCIVMCFVQGDAAESAE